MPSPTTSQPGLILMAKAPARGKVKTRLAKSIGEDRALAVYNRLLDKTKALAQDWQEEDGGYGWWVTGQDAIEWARTYDPGADVLAVQEGAHLGEKMHQAFCLAQAHWQPLIMVGCDVPELSLTYLRNICEELATSNVVLGPATDGGYVCIGLRKPDFRLFSWSSWGHDQVLQRTIDRAKNLSYSITCVEPISDLDTLEDLKHFPDLQIP